jgi:hypothetical protein
MSRLRLWTYVLLLASAPTATLLVVSYTRSGDASVFAKSQEQLSSTKNERDDTGDDHRHGQLSSTGSSPIAITAHNKVCLEREPGQQLNIGIFCSQRRE